MWIASGLHGFSNLWTETGKYKNPWPLRKHVWCYWRLYSSQMVSKTCVEKEHALSLINANYPLSYELKRKHYVVSETDGEEQFQVSPYFLSIQVYCLAVVSKSKINFRIILNRDFDFRIILNSKIFQDILISWISFRIIKTSDPSPPTSRQVFWLST